MPVDHNEFTIVKTLDKATPKLFSDDAVAAAMAGLDTSVTLERCLVKSWSTSGDADDRPTEDDHFNFQPVIHERADDGSGRVPV